MMHLNIGEKSTHMYPHQSHIALYPYIGPAEDGYDKTRIERFKNVSVCEELYNFDALMTEENMLATQVEYLEKEALSAAREIYRLETRHKILLEELEKLYQRYNEILPLVSKFQMDSTKKLVPESKTYQAEINRDLERRKMLAAKESKKEGSPETKPR